MLASNRSGKPKRPRGPTSAARRSVSETFFKQRRAYLRHPRTRGRKRLRSGSSPRLRVLSVPSSLDTTESIELVSSEELLFVLLETSHCSRKPIRPSATSESALHPHETAALTCSSSHSSQISTSRRAPRYLLPLSARAAPLAPSEEAKMTTATVFARKAWRTSPKGRARVSSSCEERTGSGESEVMMSVV